LALALLYAAWFGPQRDWTALLVFGLPPLLLAAWCHSPRSTAPFWAGVLALLWFSHGVMVAWSHPSERAFAVAEWVLAVVIVMLVGLPGMRARRQPRTGD